MSKTYIPKEGRLSQAEITEKVYLLGCTFWTNMFLWIIIILIVYGIYKFFA